MSFASAMLNSLGVAVTRLATDSRAVQPGDTFVAYPGAAADGRRFIAQAIAQGANAVIWESQGFDWQSDWRCPQLPVAGLRCQAGELADAVYHQPSERLWMIGVTGTNGKTSCSTWLATALAAQGRKCGLIGTLGNGYPGALAPSANTTPDAIRVHGLLAEFLAQGAQAVAMEVSSHALEQGRVQSVRFDVALFTNLSRDHLDYHGEMTHYAAAKRKLFDTQSLKYAVLNLDDPHGVEFARQLRDQSLEVIGYGLTEAALACAEKLGLRMVFGGELKMSSAGLELEVHSSWGRARLNSPLVGRFNAANLLGALAVLLVSDLSLTQAIAALEPVQAVAGRMQKLGGDNLPAVVVDYAHTPDALEKVLLALREVSTASGGKLGCVFGCGGDRDRGKRPMMGRVAEKLADWSLVTSDNPRSEAPQVIIAEILSGMSAARHEVIEDRAAAIAAAVQRAGRHDTVLVAGKGHEDYQEVAGVKHPFSDVAVARQALAGWRAAA
jgi:UDP-N-acetylmuramoyl-L-alanyl-D-glutamate--2,6-diaminopimelate ligase